MAGGAGSNPVDLAADLKTFPATARPANAALPAEAHLDNLDFVLKYVRVPFFSLFTGLC